MGDPNYRYTPWTPERRKAASERAKARWAAKQAAEQAERAREQTGVTGRLRLKLSQLRMENEAARVRFFATKTAIDELEAAQKLLEEAKGLLRKHGLYP